MKNYLSIDIGGTEVKYAHLSSSGKIINKGKIETSKNKVDFLNSIDKIIQQDVANLKGLAVCAPGKIDKTKICFGGALPFLDGIDFAQVYGDKYDFPIAVINDGKASILAESWLGNLKGEKNCAAITLGTAVGGGIMIDGHLLSGVHAQAGELSFMICDSSQAKTMLGSMAYRGSAVQFIRKINQVLHYQDETDGKYAFAAIKNQVPEAVAIFNKYCLKIAILILNLQTVIDINKVAIGGGISAQSILIEGINTAYDRFTTIDNPIIGQTLVKPNIVSAKFRNDSNLYGALYNLLLQVNNEK